MNKQKKRKQVNDEPEEGKNLEHAHILTTSGETTLTVTRLGLLRLKHRRQYKARHTLL